MKTEEVKIAAVDENKASAAAPQEAQKREFAFETAAPEIFVKEDGEGYEITFEMPGIGKEDIDLGVENRTLVLRATNRFPPPEGCKCVGAEFAPRHYAVSLALPEHADAGEARAFAANGVLTVKLAKRPEVKPRKIDVSAA